jgi:dTDP-4-amino-4,6-dideoxygalactose transaminase
MSIAEAQGYYYAARSVLGTIPRYEREYRTRDLLTAFRAPFETHTAPGPAELFPAAEAFLIRSGRECLYVALKILGLPPGSPVGVPLYCCDSVFAAIAAAGCQPFFLDVNSRTGGLDLNFLRAHRDSIRALVAIHMFGYPEDMNAIAGVLGAAVPVIEDCAHALFSHDRGRLAGSLSSMAFYTFGLHKPASAGGGGMLLVNAPSLKATALACIQDLDSEPLASQFRHAFICWARGIFYTRPVYGAFLASPSGKYRDKYRPGTEEQEAMGQAAPWRPAAIRTVDLALLRQRVGTFRAGLGIRASHTRILREALAGTRVSIPDEPEHGGWNHFLLPALFSSPERLNSAREFLREKRIDTAPLYRNCARDAQRFGYRQGQCPNAEQMARRVCTIPNHASLTARDVRYIAGALRAAAL